MTVRDDVVNYKILIYLDAPLSDFSSIKQEGEEQLCLEYRLIDLLGKKFLQEEHKVNCCVTVLLLFRAFLSANYVHKTVQY